MTQLSLFNIDFIKLKEGKEKCPCCKRLMRAYKKTLDKRLVDLAYEAEAFMRNHNRYNFQIREVFADDHLKVNDFQKLRYFGLFKKVGRNNLWELTPRGYQFLFEGYAVPRYVWVFNRQVILRDDEKITVGKIDPRWQEHKLDWALDYLPQKYNAEIQQKDLII
jgi:hypothetical protein